MMSYDSILYSVTDGVARITLNRPESLNSLSSQLLSELREAALKAPGDGARALLITGAGRGFCAGADLSEPPPLDDNGKLDLGKALDERYHPALDALFNLDIPVVTAINGVAAGAGASFALAGDIVIAARSAKFRQAFVKIGLLPDASGTWLLPRLVGRARAMGMAMLGEDISADQALAWGMIWQVVDDEQLDATATDMAKHLAAMPTKALASIRKAINASADNDLKTQLEIERQSQYELGQTQDFQEGVLAFMQKRAAHFTGT